MRSVSAYVQVCLTFECVALQCGKEARVDMSLDICECRYIYIYIYIAVPLPTFLEMGKVGGPIPISVNMSGRTQTPTRREAARQEQNPKLLWQQDKGRSTPTPPPATAPWATTILPGIFIPHGLALYIPLLPRRGLVLGGQLGCR